MQWTQVFSRNAIENSGSAARDFCMLERNMLAHIKLALLLSVLSSSLILQTRLVPTTDEGGYVQEYGIPLAIIQFVAALLAIAAGVWEFHVGCRDLMRMRAFLVAPKPHFAIMTVVMAIVFTTCVILLDKSDA
ncbi:hypothetical protein DFS33DRAFT_1263028 [Desarmillaria ectypa]|nr:hypothetical protein DFS33DRAFT_1263028 [Desarmillaria ectypa]